MAFLELERGNALLTPEGRDAAGRELRMLYRPGLPANVSRNTTATFYRSRPAAGITLQCRRTRAKK